MQKSSRVPLSGGVFRIRIHQHKYIYFREPSGIDFQGFNQTFSTDRENSEERYLEPFSGRKKLRD